MTTGDPDRIRIEPIEVRSPSGRPAPPRRLLPGLLALAAIVPGIALLAVAGFVLTAQRVTLQIDPVPDRLAVEGGWLQPRVGNVFLLRPGEYRVLAGKAGYHDLQSEIRVTGEGSAEFAFDLKPLDGRLSVEVIGADTDADGVPGARVSIGDRPPIEAPVHDLILPPGPIDVAADAPRYQTVRTNLVIEGQGGSQSIRLVLPVGWATVEASTEPPGAVVWVGEDRVGTAPVTFETDPGTIPMRIEAEGYEAFSTQLVARAGETVRLGVLRLDEAWARLSIRSVPSGALVSVDGAFEGATPLDVALRPRETHDVLLSKAGFKDLRREVAADPGETVEWVGTLEPVTGTVRFDVTPADAELIIDGKSWGPPPAEIELAAVEHQLELRKEGYRPHQGVIRPKPDYPLLVEVALSVDAPAPEAARQVEIRTGTGYVLRRIEPGSFRMGESRRTQGRRSNETLVNVALRRPFYMGANEVTNGEFRAFDADHDSGRIRDHTLNRDDQPVVNVSWAEAARYCNWLSRQDGLTEVYQVEGESLSARDPLPAGYRLPTEAEWAYCARVRPGGDVARYPWGTKTSPPERSGNYADQAAAPLLARVLPGYRDGSVVTTKPGSFDAGPWGLFDMGGNVSEWCHDVYGVYSYEPEQTYVDPRGPDEGTHHVIRGSSWKDGIIWDLRLSYREYGDEGRNDVGFRIARYADGEGNAE